MKILYIAPENTVGTLNLWKRGHESRGHTCRTITMYRSSGGYPEDICLDLPFINSSPTYIRTRDKFVSAIKKDHLQHRPPRWSPTIWERAYFRFRDWIWSFKIEPVLQELDVFTFDVVHFEWGLDLYRSGALARRLKDAGVKIICHYHGQDLRNRGVIPILDSLADLNLTNELDLLDLHPRLNYLFLPFEVKKYQPKKTLNEPLVISHATTNWFYKGTNKIVEVGRELEKSHGIVFHLMEQIPNEEVLCIKAESDIYIDQITDRGGWGYGMNSLESLSLGVATCTRMNERYQAFLPDHPFVNCDETTLHGKLVKLIENPDQILKKGREGRRWVERTHDLDRVLDQLYEYYQQLGLSC